MFGVSDGIIEKRTCDADISWTEIMQLMKDRVQTMQDFGPLSFYFFIPPDYTTEEAANIREKMWKDEHGEILQSGLLIVIFADVI
jgi:hypothetical protein